MQEQVAARLQTLRQEYETGQRMLADLEARQLELQQSMLRISGAILVLEELLSPAEPPTDNGAAPTETTATADPRPLEPALSPPSAQDDPPLPQPSG